MRLSLTSSAFFAALLLANAPVRATETITWMMSDFPPVGELIDGKPGNGMADQVVRYLVADRLGPARLLCQRAAHTRPGKAGLFPQRLPAAPTATDRPAMLALNRADYTIELDFVMTHAILQSPELASLKSLPLAGGPGLLVGGIACPRTAWGREAIRHIDTLLASPEGAAALSQAQMRWISKDATQRYGAAMKEFFRQLETPQVQEYRR
ncbi:hypothetical protein [Duganella levis]|uniref:Uncharacterized protein n=1 Tax=Duganella levis TaxID=2692169 RepID=A0ABW9VWJ8_9BURK|nr:hypothetical protein [Duganella levis]MYN25949.1 hypothetical protein [Duganella levis]